MTFSSNRLTKRMAVVLAVCALALGAGACSGGGDDSDDGARAGSEDGGGDSGGRDSGGDSGSVGTPQDAENLGISARSEEGVTLTVNGVSFDGDNILVDLEILNGSAEEVSLHDTTWEGTELRLVDDEGNPYNFVPPEATDIDLASVAIGESVSGTLQFVGPLLSETAQLYVVTNMDHDIEAIENWQPGDTCSDACGGQWPGLVAAIPVEWG